MILNIDLKKLDVLFIKYADKSLPNFNNPSSPISELEVKEELKAPFMKAIQVSKNIENTFFRLETRPDDFNAKLELQVQNFQLAILNCFINYIDKSYKEFYGNDNRSIHIFNITKLINNMIIDAKFESTNPSVLEIMILRLQLETFTKYVNGMKNPYFSYTDPAPRIEIERNPDFFMFRGEEYQQSLCSLKPNSTTLFFKTGFRNRSSLRDNLEKILDDHVEKIVTLMNDKYPKELSSFSNYQ